MHPKEASQRFLAKCGVQLANMCNVTMSNSRVVVIAITAMQHKNTKVTANSSLASNGTDLSVVGSNDLALSMLKSSANVFVKSS
ncbi:hypothetical protein D918_02212 [Trichuris suis]|nr:hypothetical protein D918_02212 [Trichuris suis]